MKRIAALHPIVDVEAARFVAGGRIRLQRAVDREAAARATAELEAAGASVAVEPHHASADAVLELDQFNAPEADVGVGASVNQQMMAQLQSLDGDEAPSPVAPPATTAAAVDPAAPVDDARFRPGGEWHKPMDLELETSIAPPPPAPPLPTENDAAASAYERPRLAPPPADEEEWKPVPGRIANGALRKNPPVRIAVGVVLGLGLGWMFAQPYAHRAERHVAQLRAQADAERYRPVDEAQARVRDLDRQADDGASNGAIAMAVIWVLVGGAAFAGWWRAT